MNKLQAQKIINQTIADYNLISAKFTSTRSRLTPDLINLFKNIKAGSSVLDYGCGNGRMAELFDPKYYTGLDPSAKLIQFAKQKFPKHKFYIIKPSEVPKNQIYDNIICLAVIHHIPTTEAQIRLLGNFYDILNPTGKLIMTAWNLENKSDNKILNVPFKYDGGEITRKIYTFTQMELETLVKKAGFEISSSQIIPRNRGRYCNIEIIASK